MYQICKYLIKTIKTKPKLVVFDDFTNLPDKDIGKINDYLISGRKFGFAVWLMAQNYV